MKSRPTHADFEALKPDVGDQGNSDVLADWQIMLAIAAFCWMSRYWLSSRFGFYEDDYWRIPTALSIPLRRVPASFLHQIFAFQQGRPLHAGFIGFFAAIGSRFHGLQGVYWTGYGISVLNALLLFTLLRRAEAGQAISAAAASAFSVFPADASQTFLTHALGVQPALTLVLAAWHLWLRGLRVLPWAMVFLALFCYETPVPLFAAAPLLLPQWNARMLLRHASVLALGIAAVAALRKYFGEQRVAHLDLFRAIRAAVHNISMGPFVSLTSYGWRPFETARHFDATAGILGLVAALIGFGLFLRCDTSGLDRLPRLAGAGMACLLLAYSLPVILDAAERDGRATRVHYAASVGCAILVACLFGFLGKRFGRVVAAAAMALVLGTSTVAGVAVQRDYQRSWDLQRAFWSDVVRLCPDLALGKVVLIDGFRALPEARHLKVFEWHTPLVLSQVYHFPGPGASAPRLFLMKSDWRHYLDPNGGITINENTAVWPFFWETPHHFAGSNLIVLEVHAGRLVRVGEPGPSGDPPRGILYKYLLGP